jgi:hypothetical protein
VLFTYEVGVTAAATKEDDRLDEPRESSILTLLCVIQTYIHFRGIFLLALQGKMAP